MSMYLGDYPVGSTIYVPFATYDKDDGSSITMTGLAVTDIEIYKNGSATQRASDAGYTLLDTDGIDFDGITGIHGFSIDTADNTTAGFFTAGADYWVVVSSITVDAVTINFVAGVFSIENRRCAGELVRTTIATLASQTSFTLTAGSADNNAYVGCTAVVSDIASAIQKAVGYISAYTGSTKTITLAADPAIFTMAAGDNITILAGANVKAIGSTVQTARDIGASVLLSSGTGTGQVSLSSGTVSLTATTGLGNQTANITGNLSGSVGSVTGAVGSVTAGVTLATAAITSAKFDESTAFPLKAADTGATYIARAPSGTETLDTIKSAISGIGSGTGAALNFEADDDNANNTVSGLTVNAVGTPTGTYTNTSADDASTHVIASADVTGTQTITWAYGFSCGAARSASKVTWKGTLSGTAGQSDTFTFAAYNWGTDVFDTRYVIANTSAAVQTFDIPLLAAHTGSSGSETGKVVIRITFAEADAGTLTTNLILVQAQQSGSLVGYSDGAVWLNTAASNTNTTPYVDGVADNPVSTITAALTIAGALKLKRIRVANGSSVTLVASVESYSMIGKNWTLALGGQSISGSYFEGATVTGTGTGATPPEFMECHIVGTASAPTLPPCSLLLCGVNTTATYPLTAGSAGQFLFVDCFSEVAGSGTPYFTFSGVNGINIRRWSGGTNITLDNSSTTLSVEVLTGGGQTIAVGGADVEIRGICRAVTLTGVTSDSTVQIDAVIGPISIAGANGTVNIYGVCGDVTDSRTGSPTLSNKAVSQATINTEVDTGITDGANGIADAILARNVSGGSSTGRTVKQALHVLRNKVDIATGTMTVYDTDDASTSWTASVTGTTGADPITTVDPA